MRPSCTIHGMTFSKHLCSKTTAQRGNLRKGTFAFCLLLFLRVNTAPLHRCSSKQSAAHLSNLCQNKKVSLLPLFGSSGLNRAGLITLIAPGFYSNRRHQGKNGCCLGASLANPLAFNPALHLNAAPLRQLSIPETRPKRYQAFKVSLPGGNGLQRWEISEDKQPP